jgi:hypothetical protein
MIIMRRQDREFIVKPVRKGEWNMEWSLHFHVATTTSHIFFHVASLCSFHVAGSVGRYHT